MAAQRLLLVLDNFESVRDMPDPGRAAGPLPQQEQDRMREFLSRLAAGGRSAVIITSRSPEDWLGPGVRRIAQVMIEEPSIRIVAASTIQTPHCKCGMKSKMSTRNASSVSSRVGMVRMSSERRKRGECEGRWKCAAIARPRHTSTKNAAIGWTIKMEVKLYVYDLSRGLARQMSAQIVGRQIDGIWYVHSTVVYMI